MLSDSPGLKHTTGPSVNSQGEIGNEGTYKKRGGGWWLKPQMSHWLRCASSYSHTQTCGMAKKTNAIVKAGNAISVPYHLGKGNLYISDASEIQHKHKVGLWNWTTKSPTEKHLAMMRNFKIAYINRRLLPCHNHLAVYEWRQSSCPKVPGMGNLPSEWAWHLGTHLDSAASWLSSGCTASVWPLGGAHTAL